MNHLMLEHLPGVGVHLIAAYLPLLERREGSLLSFSLRLVVDRVGDVYGNPDLLRLVNVFDNEATLCSANTYLRQLLIARLDEVDRFFSIVAYCSDCHQGERQAHHDPGSSKPHLGSSLISAAPLAHSGMFTNGNITTAAVVTVRANVLLP